MKNRARMSSPGNSPPNSAAEAQVPMTGTDRMMADAMRSPVPDSPSSGSEQPVKPARNPNTNRPTPSTQLASRGRRQHRPSGGESSVDGGR